MTKQIIISATGEAHGWGSDRYKWVSRLSNDERRHVRNGTATVLVANCPPCGGGRKTGCTVRRVAYKRGRYYHRCACDIIS